MWIYTHLMMIIHISLSLKARSIHGNNKRYFLSRLLHRDLLRWQAVYIHLSSRGSLAVLLNWLSLFFKAFEFALIVVKFMSKNWKREKGEMGRRSLPSCKQLSIPYSLSRFTVVLDAREERESNSHELCVSAYDMFGFITRFLKEST